MSYLPGCHTASGTLVADDCIFTLLFSLHDYADTNSVKVTTHTFYIFSPKKKVVLNIFATGVW